MHQVIIVGAGPGGAYLAYLLANNGLDVLVIEKEQLPRHKPCGGGLTPKVIKLLDFDLSPVIEDVIYSLVLTRRLNDPVKINTEKPIVFMTSRDKFDAYLLERARSAGARVLENTRIDRMQQNSACVTVASGDTEWQGSILAGADGAQGIVGRTLGLNRNYKIAKALEIHVPLPPNHMKSYRGAVKVDYGLVPSGYAWIFPKTDNLSMGVGTINSRTKGLANHLTGLVQAEGITAEAAAVTKRGWTIPLNLSMGDLHNGRVLLIGDAAGLANGFTGEGIYQALLSASMAAEVIIEQIKQPSPALHKYSASIKEKLLKEHSSAFRITQLFYPAAGMIHRMISRQNDLALELLETIAGEISYAQMLNSFCKQLPGALIPGLSIR